jgi:large subunit ribosomal protein L21
MFAIIETGGKQYKVEEGSTIRVEKLEGQVDSTIEIDKVLLVADGEDVSVGTPYLENVTVSTTKVDDVKNRKLIIYKYKRRKDSDKKKGHRQKATLLRIDKINL